MFNMDMMKQGAEAFGRIAEAIEDIRDVARAYAWRDNLECPRIVEGTLRKCAGIAAHDGDHY